MSNKPISPLYEDKLENYFIVLETCPLQYPLHVHSYIEFVHVIEGSLEMQIGNHSYSFYPGDATIIFPDIPHSYHTLSDKIHTKLAIANFMQHLLPLHKTILLNYYPLNPVIHLSEINPDIKLFEDRLFQIDPTEDNTIFVGSLCSLILCYFYPKMNLNPLPKGVEKSFADTIISYVSKHSLEDISLSSVAQYFGISTSKLSRFFTNTIETSFTNYIKHQRINNAIILLCHSKMNITEIAYECGFNNQQEFNRSFRQITSTTPTAYKKHYLESACSFFNAPTLPHTVHYTIPSPSIPAISING